MAHGLSIAFCPVSRKKVRFSLCDSHTLRLAREHAPMLLIFPPRHSIILPLSVCAGVSEWQTMRTQNPLVATPCGFKSHRRHHVGMDCAPFKKPSRLAGLFSYRSVIPPSPHKTLLRKFLRGPRRPAGWQTQAVYRLRRLFLQNRRALILLLHLGPRAAAYAAVGLETRPRAQSLRQKIPLRGFSRGPRRPAGRQRTALHSKSPAV